MTDLPTFPPGFLWGAATAAYQVEGAVDEGGRGLSIWDVFAHTPGRIRGGHTGDVACDQYHRYLEDVALLAGLGLNVYRFSIAWPRVQPDGVGAANREGLDYYDRLIDALLSQGIIPFPTLYHWDLPQALEDAGGWLSRDTAHRFAVYAELVAARLSDRVPRWITLNEPFIQMVFGYALGTHAPGRRLLLEALPAGHHLLLGHGLAVAALRASGAGEVLLAHNYTPVEPASDSREDAAAAAGYDILYNRMLTDPLLLGSYPDLPGLGLPAGDPPPFVLDGDLATISAPLDGLGVNYYNPSRIAAASTGAWNPIAPLPFAPVPIDGVPVTGFGWPIVPSGLRDLLLQLHHRYGEALPPIYITENGCAFPDGVHDATGTDHATRTGTDHATRTGTGTDHGNATGIGIGHDPDRIAYLDGHLRALHEALDAGVDVRGYFVWSLLDNFEWAEGYHQRFGLVHVDFATGRRTPRDSFAWLREQLRRQPRAMPTAAGPHARRE